MKKFIITLAIVLLATTAWGQPRDIYTVTRYLSDCFEFSKTNYDCERCCSEEVKHHSTCMGACAEEKLQFIQDASLEPVWGDSSECMEKYLSAHPRARGARFDITIAEWCADNTHKPIWGDSRYRLERNEITGLYRIAENRDGRWYGYLYSKARFQTGQIAEEYPSRTLPEMIQMLSNLRAIEIKDREIKIQREREESAWRPIR